MPMEHINVSLSQFSGENIDPEQLAATILALKEAGCRVDLKVDRPEAIAVIQQLPVVSKKQAARVMAMPQLIGWGLLASLGAILVGWMGL